MTRSIYDLSYTLVNTRHPEHDKELCEAAFHFWHQSWTETFQSIPACAGQKLFSDDFLDREASILHQDGEPVALFFYNWFDLSRESILKHSYFRHYPTEVFTLLRESGLSRAMVVTYMTVHPLWRTRYTNVPIPDLLFSLAVKRFQEAGDPALIFYIRRDKSFSESAYRHGSRRIFSSEAYDIKADFCLISQEDARISSLPGMAEAVDYFWKGRSMNGQQPLLEWQEPASIALKRYYG